MRDVASASLNRISRGGPKGIRSFFQSRLISLPSVLRARLAFCSTLNGSLKSCRAIPIKAMSAHRSHKKTSSAAASFKRRFLRPACADFARSSSRASLSMSTPHTAPSEPIILAAGIAKKPNPHAKSIKTFPALSPASVRIFPGSCYSLLCASLRYA
jgi:hypothetical protein